MIGQTPTGAEAAFTRPLRALGWSIQALLIANALSRPAAREQALRAVMAAIGINLALGHLLGAGSVLEEVASSGEPDRVRSVLPTTIDIDTLPPLPPVDVPHFPVIGKPPVFRQALKDIVTRVPKIVRPGMASTAAEVGHLYGTEHVFAVAKKVDEATLTRVKGIIEEGILEGKSVDEQVKKIVAETKDWTRGYAETVYRTNLNTAQVNGRFHQMRTPAARIVTPALMFVATGSGASGTARTKDERTRPNHWAADGMVAGPEHHWWAELRPPLGYNCRCTVMPVTWALLRRMGLVNPDGSLRNRPPRSGAAPDPGFTPARLPA